jgi:hypothetical protein
VLVSARSLIEGFDVPAADIGIVVASSSSVRQRIQTLGRILRKPRSKTGGAKEAVLHVLYMAGTVDELIYEKNDWNAVIGAERNTYYQFDPLGDLAPMQLSAPPRVPAPEEGAIDLDALKPGEIYPGRYDGEEYSCDTHGNVFDAHKRLIMNPQGVNGLVRRIKESAGRFRVTPRRRVVLVRVPFEGAWVTRYVTRLAEPFRLENRDSAKPESKDIAQLNPGDEYNGQIDPAEEFFIKRRADTAMVARKVRHGEVFARTCKDAIDQAKGLDAERLVRAIVQASNRGGEWISRFRLNPDGHAFYLADGKAYYLTTVSSGFEFPEAK